MTTSRGKLSVHGALTAALACSFALAPAVVHAATLSLAPSPWLAVDRNRSAIVADIVARWSEVTQTAKTGVLTEAQLRDALGKLRADQLFSASLAGSYAALVNTLVDAGAFADDKASAKPQQKIAGSGPELVYTPITPCRILDSRFGVGGSFAPGATQAFKATNPGGTFSSQGGSPTNCGIPVKARAVTLNFTVFNTGAGPAFISAWPFGQPNPGTATLNWTTAGAQVANGAIVPLCTGGGCASDFNVFASSNTDMVADVVGYFTEPSGGYVLTVAPSGAQYTSIQAAIDAAAAVATQAQPYLVRVAPGTYTEQITLKDWVDVEGAGDSTTYIIWSAGWPTVWAGAGAEVRNVRIENSASGTLPGGGSVAVAQNAQGAHGFTRFTDSAIWASGPNDAVAARIAGGSIWFVRSDLQGGVPSSSGTAVGLSTSNTAFVRVRDSRLLANTTGPTRYGVERTGSSTVRINNTTIGAAIVGAPSCISVFDLANNPLTC